MLNWILLRFGFCVLPLDHVARALAAAIVDSHDLTTLSDADTIQELRRRYVSIAIQTGLPLAVQQQVARDAWHYIDQARGPDVPGTVGRYFTFYR